MESVPWPPGHLCGSSPVVAADEGTGGGAAKKRMFGSRKVGKNPGKIVGKSWEKGGL